MPESIPRISRAWGPLSWRWGVTPCLECWTDMDFIMTVPCLYPILLGPILWITSYLILVRWNPVQSCLIQVFSVMPTLNEWQMAVLPFTVPAKHCIFNCMLIKPKCVWKDVDFFDFFHFFFQILIVSQPYSCLFTIFQKWSHSLIDEQLFSMYYIERAPLRQDRP